MGLFDFFTGDHGRRAADAANQGIMQGLDYMGPHFQAGRGALKNQYGAGLKPFQNILKQANQGAGMYGNALGLGGAGGQQKAYDAFMGTPGIQAGFDMGMQGIDRGAASRGMLGSGNTNIDLQKFATDYSSQKFGDYMNQLSPYLGQQMGAAQGIGGLRANLGNQLNQNLMGQGTLGLQAHTGMGQNNAAAQMAAGQGGANLFGFLGNMGGKLLGMLPGMGGTM